MISLTAPLQRDPHFADHTHAVDIATMGSEDTQQGAQQRKRTNLKWEIAKLEALLGLSKRALGVPIKKKKLSVDDQRTLLARLEELRNKSKEVPVCTTNSSCTN